MTARDEIEQLLAQHPDGLTLLQIRHRLPHRNYDRLYQTLKRSKSTYIHRYNTAGQAVYCQGVYLDVPNPLSRPERIRALLLAHPQGLTAMEISQKLEGITREDANEVLCRMQGVQPCGIAVDRKRKPLIWRLA